MTAFRKALRKRKNGEMIGVGNIIGVMSHTRCIINPQTFLKVLSITQKEKNSNQC